MMTIPERLGIDEKQVEEGYEIFKEALIRIEAGIDKDIADTILFLEEMCQGLTLRECLHIAIKIGLQKNARRKVAI